jgi:hypothetical protein
VRFATKGDRAVVRNGRREWSNDDFATLFLRWLSKSYPKTRGKWVCVPDIEKHLLERFRAATGCIHLQLGALERGLGAITEKREMAYLDATGRRCTMTEYLVSARRRATASP